LPFACSLHPQTPHFLHLGRLELALLGQLLLRLGLGLRTLLLLGFLLLFFLLALFLFLLALLLLLLALLLLVLFLLGGLERKDGKNGELFLHLAALLSLAVLLHLTVLGLDGWHLFLILAVLLVLLALLRLSLVRLGLSLALLGLLIADIGNPLIPKRRDVVHALLVGPLQGAILLRHLGVHLGDEVDVRAFLAGNFRPRNAVPRLLQDGLGVRQGARLVLHQERPELRNHLGIHLGRRELAGPLGLRRTPGFFILVVAATVAGLQRAKVEKRARHVDFSFSLVLVSLKVFSSTLSNFLTQ